MAELIWEGKYRDGKKQAPVRVELPFQTIETVNESAADRKRTLELFGSGRETEWRNRLIWGDKKYVLPSLLPEFAGKVDLIYIDPPFDTGADFSVGTTIPGTDEGFVKEPSIIEQKAYRDTWGAGIDSYLSWFYETIILLRDLLTETGAIYCHLDWHVGHYAKGLLDEIFGAGNFRNEIVWWYYNKLQGNVRHFPKNHDVIFFYTSSKSYEFKRLSETRDKPIRQQKRVWDSKTGTLKQARDESGKLEYYTVTERYLDDVWKLPYIMPADQTENLRYPTQKPEELVNRILEASSVPGSLVLDCFVGSGTTAAVAEKLGRRWIACDLGRFAIHTARKRLLGIPNVKPFVVQNLGKYERQAWAVAEFAGTGEERLEQQRGREAAYRKFILELYGAEPVSGYTWLHGVKNGRMVHVGAVDAPVTISDVKAIAREVWKAAGTGKKGPEKAAADILGWEFAFELNETAKDVAAEARVDVNFKKIPREVLEKKAVEQGDIHFFELGALGVDAKVKKRELWLKLTDFVIPREDVPEEAWKAIKHWSQMVDYWAVDWDYKNDTFHNQWQAYRTRKEPKIELETTHEYEAGGTYQVMVKVIDILGNDTTKTLEVKVP